MNLIEDARKLSLQLRETPEESRSKLRELILYVADRCEKDERFGAIKLNKIILFADISAYVRYGESITGSQYMRLPQGPVPLHMRQILDKMQAEQEIVVRKQTYFDQIQHRVISLRDAVLDSFTAREIALIEDAIQYLWEADASVVSNLSHGTAWKIVPDGEIIPYQAFHLSNEGLTEMDIAEAQMLSDRYYWN